ncbi:MAG TPA: hypothetical protein VNZ85_09925 [Caulobacter sp.]|nr:hypothetical protein [Caulobacter sp.]
MPKYRHRYHLPERAVDGLGTLIYGDDDAAIQALAALDNEGVSVELWCQERQPRLLAIKAADGSVRSVERP